MGLEVKCDYQKSSWFKSLFYETNLGFWRVVSVAERLRRRVGMQKVPGSIQVVGTAFTRSHQPTQLSILLG